MFIDAVGYKELCVLRPAITALGEAYLLVAQRLAMSGSRVLPVRRAITDVAVQNYERRTLLGLSEDVEGMFDTLDIVGITDA